ncbi:MAG: ATP-binding protein [bacterium]
MSEIFYLIILQIINASLGAIVLYKNRKNKINIYFALLILFIIFWSVSNYMSDNSLNNGLVWTRITFMAAIFIAWSLLRFSIIFPKRIFNLNKYFFYFTNILPLLISILLLTDLIIENVERYESGVTVITGKLYFLFLIYALIFFIGSIYALIRSYIKTKGNVRIQFKYFALGLFISLTIGLLTNLILPSITGNFIYSKFGPYALVFFVSFATYAIVKHRLMDIRIFIVRSITYSVLVLIITSVFAVSIIFFGQLFGGTMTGAIISAVLVAIGYNPLRDWLRKATDKIFFKDKYDYNETLKDLSRKVSQTIELKQLSKSIIKDLKHILKIDSIALVLWNHQAGNEAIANDGFKHEKLEKLEFNSPLYKFLNKEKSTVVFNELEHKMESSPDETYKKTVEEVTDYLRDLDSDLVTPIILKGRLIGTLVIGAKLSGDMFSPEDLELLDTLSPQIATSIDNANLYEETKQRVKELSTLYDLGKAINATLEEEKTLNYVMDAVIDSSNSDRALLYLLKEEDNCLYATMGRGDDENLYKNICIDPKTSILGQVIDRRKTVVVENAEANKFVNKEHIQKLGTKAFIALPLMTKDKVLGVIGVDNAKTNRPLSEINLSILKALANQAAIAIENARLYSETQQFADKLKIEVKKATAKLAEANAHLKELDEAKSEFLSVAAHQLRTPVSGIKGYLSMLSEGDFGKMTKEQKRIVNTNLENIERLVRLIDIFLNVSRIESSRFRLDRTEIQITDLVTSVVSEFQIRAKNKGLKLNWKKPHKKYPVLFVDPDKMRIAVTNLLDNAIKYTLKGSVDVTCDIDEKYVHINVRDTGVGIDPNEVDKLFEKFVRARGIAKVNADGSGLGLYIIKKIIETHGGKVVVNSKGKGHGTTFTLLVPIKAPKSDSPHLLASDQK